MGQNTEENNRKNAESHLFVYVLTSVPALPRTLIYNLEKELTLFKNYYSYCN